jgi:hypothetical protein
VADSEVRQKFEATVKHLSETLDKLRPGTGPGVGVLLMMAWDEAFAAGMRAGEIAMREKAAERIHHAFCRTIDRMQNICDCDEMAAAIRALAISGAEEATPAELP